MEPFDNAELLGCFKAEATERLQKLNDGVLILEKSGIEDSVLDTLFREAHTLKGAAAMMGCEEISVLAHGFEDILSALRRGDVGVAAITGVLFQCCDAIKEMVDSLEGQRAAEVDVRQILKRIKGFLDDVHVGEGGELENSPGLEKMDIESAGMPESNEAPPPDRVPTANGRPEEIIRVATDKLDCLANTVGEIVIGRAKLAGGVGVLRRVSEIVQQQNRAIGEIYGQLSNSMSVCDHSISEELTTVLNKCKEANRNLAELTLNAYGEQHEAMCRFETIIDQLDGDVTALRMRPISTVFDLFPRIVRDLAEEYGKSVELKVTGGETELDRSMLEGIKDPLMHLLRNAVDHGIESRQDRVRLNKTETGTIRLLAANEGDRIFITLGDNGGGIDPDRIKVAAVRKGIVDEESANRMTDEDAIALIFAPGFSTKTTVTGVSGRGVGMDVVRKYVEDDLRGQVLVDSKPNRGTIFTLILPLTLAVTPSVLVKVSGQLFAIPAHSVQMVTKVGEDDWRSTDGKLAANIVGSVVPLVRLDRTLSLPHSNNRDRQNLADGHLEVVVVEHGNRRLAFVIDELVEEQDIVVKRLEAPLDNLRFVAGITILEKGEVVPILQVHQIIEAGESVGSAHDIPEHVPAKHRRTDKQHVLVVEDSLTTRELMKNIIQSAGFNVDTAIDGIEALNKINNQKFDLIVTDIQMPRMDGFEMTGRIKQDAELKNIPVIIVTSLFRDEERKRGMEVGADAYIRKSEFDQSKLVDTIKKLVI